MRKLYKFDLNKRVANVTSIFIAEDSLVNKLVGKHIFIYHPEYDDKDEYELATTDFTILCVEHEALHTIALTNGSDNICGINPIEIYQQELNDEQEDFEYYDESDEDEIQFADPEIMSYSATEYYNKFILI